jgi:Holliday junction resolvasome RuvABC endonuclease subunit
MIVACEKFVEAFSFMGDLYPFLNERRLQMSYYLGLDLASVQTGWAIANVKDKKVIDLKKGTISFSKSMKLHKRLHGLRKQIEEISHQYPLEPFLIKEQPLHDHNRRISGAIFKAHGYVESLFPTFEFEDMNPIEVKKFVAGYGHASKESVQKGVRRLMRSPLQFNNFDESDAVAILLAGLAKHKIIVI